MGMTATVLGREFFGRTAQEMNKLLLAHGFLEGGPGAYRPTTLGEQFAKWVDKDNGYGGFAAQAWSFLSWDDRLVDALKASMEANPKGVVPPAVTPPAVAETFGPAAVRTGSGAGSQLLNNKVGVAVAVLAALGATPVARRTWQEKVQPAASRVRARIGGRKPAGDAGGADEQDSGSGPEQPPHRPQP